MRTRKVASIGEAMLELSPAGVMQNNSSPRVEPADKDRLQQSSAYNLAFAGDSLNTIFYYQHYAAASNSECYYVSALGTDAMSQRMLQAWQGYGLHTELIAQVPERQPGLYIINLDDQGERTFMYYRAGSAASMLCDSPQFDAIATSLLDFDEIYFSGITLGIYSPAARQRLFEVLQHARSQGARIVFDTNYRPRLWESAAVALSTIEKFYALVDVAVPTFEDEVALFGDNTPADTARRLQAAGINEVVVKQGSDGCFLFVGDSSEHVPIERAVKVVDTTAAGDSFNGAYLAARAEGMEPRAAAERAHQVAAAVIQARGALLVDGLPVFSRGG